MSFSMRTRSRSRWAGESARGWDSQNIPWWAITSCAPSPAARVNNSRCAETPVTTVSISPAPGTCSPLGP